MSDNNEHLTPSRTHNSGNQEILESGTASLSAVSYDLSGGEDNEESSSSIIPFQNVIPLFPDEVDCILMDLIKLNLYGEKLNQTPQISSRIEENFVPTLRRNYISSFNTVVNQCFDVSQLDQQEARRILRSERALYQHTVFYISRTNSVSSSVMNVLESLPSTSEYVDELQVLVNHTNPSFNAFNRAEKLYDAMYGGFVSWGTDESAVFTNLQNLDPLSSLTLKKAYAAFCNEVKGETRSLASDLDDEMDGAEQDRFEALLEGNQSRIVAAGLRDAVDGLGTDEDAIMDLLRNKTPEEIRLISEAYQSEYNESLLSRLQDELDEDSHDLARMNALMQSNTNEADAHALDQAMHGGFFGWGTDEEAIETVYETRRQEVETNANNDSLSYTELQDQISASNLSLETAYNAEYTVEGDSDSSLRNAFDSETTENSGYRQIFHGLADNDQNAVDAGRLMNALTYQEVTDEGGNTSIYVSGNGNKVNDILDNSYQRAYEQVYRDHRSELNANLVGVTDRFQREAITREYRMRMEEMAYAIAEQNFTAVTSSFNDNDNDATLQEQISLWGASDHQDRAQHLIENGGYLRPAERLHYAISGIGTDIDMIRQTLSGRSREEIRQIDEEFQLMNDGNSLSYMLFEDSNFLGVTETDGRDEADLRLMIGGVAENRQQELEIAEQRYSNEISMGGLNWADTGAMEFHLERLRQFNQHLDDGESSEFYDTLLGLESQTFDESVGRYRSQVDSISNAITTGIAVVAGVIVAVFTAGAGTGLSVLLISSAVSSGVNMAAKRIVQGSSYGYNAFTIDVGLAVLDLALAGLTRNMGDDIVNGSEYLARLSQDSSFRARLLASTIADTYSSVPGNAVQAAASQFVNESNYNSDNPMGDATINFIKDFSISTAMGIAQSTLNTSAVELRNNLRSIDTQIESHSQQDQIEEVSLDGGDMSTQREEVSSESSQNQISEEVIPDGGDMSMQGEEVSSESSQNQISEEDIIHQNESGDLIEINQPVDASSQSTSPWNDDSINVNEFLAIIKRDHPNTSLNEQALRAKFAEGSRFNPETRRWVKNWRDTNAETSTRPWNDDSIDVNEFLAIIKRDHPNTSLNEQELRAKFAEDSRFNPETRRWVKNWKDVNLANGVRKLIDDLDVSEALSHLKSRKIGRRKKGIVGCHDKTAFFDQNVIRSVDASEIPNYLTRVGKNLDEVEEIVIISKTLHPQVPGVEIVEYKIPSLSNTNPPLTTGQLSVPSNGGVKTLYSPDIWTDVKLNKAVKEAMRDAHKNLDEVIDGKFIGLTKDGYKIEGYIESKVLKTFYFL